MAAKDRVIKMLKDLFKFKVGTIEAGYLFGALTILAGIGIGIYSVIKNSEHATTAVGFVTAGLAAITGTNYTGASVTKTTTEKSGPDQN